MDQDATWYGGRPRPHCARWAPSSPPQKGGTAPIFGPSLLWSNGWMDQDAAWYDGRPRPGQHCVRCVPRSTPKGHSPQISAHVCCGQTSGRIKMPLGAKVGLDPGRIVTWGPSSYLPKGAQHPNFRPTSIVAKRPPISATAEHLLFQPASKVKVGVPQSTGSISAASGPKFTILWEHVEEILLRKIFFDCRYMP